MKNLILFGILGLLLSNCTMHSPLKFQPSSGTPSDPTEWKKYGAYLEYDEKYVEYGKKIPLSDRYSYRFVHRQRLVITSQKGTQYGTLYFNNNKKGLTKFNIKVVGKDNQLIPQDIAALKKSYKRKGKVVLKNVTPGVIIEVYIEHTHSVQVWVGELLMAFKIPVKEASFNFSHHSSSKFKLKGYGNIGAPKVSNSEGFTHRVYRKNNLMPISNLSNTKPLDVIAPRIVFTVSKISGYYSVGLESWGDITKEYEQYFYGRTYFSSNSKISRVVKDLSKDKSSDETVDAILNYVQNNITLKSMNLKKIDPDEVLRSGEANAWGIAAFTAEMLKLAEIDYSVYLTRAHSELGFDPGFINPMACQIPLIVVHSEEDYPIWPYWKGSLAGFLPVDYDGLSGVALVDGRVKKLPLSDFKESSIAHEIEAHPYDDKSDTITITWDGITSMYLRSNIPYLDEKDRVEFVQDYLTTMDKANAVRKVFFNNSDVRESKFVSVVQFNNKTPLIKKKRKEMKNIGGYFMGYYEGYDAERTIDWVTTVRSKVTEKVSIVTGKKKVTYKFACKEVENDMFVVTCTKKKKRKELILTRTVVENKGIYTAAYMKSIESDIVSLNQIKESWVTRRK
ncbi:MAG: hypothetical protein OCC49_02285 [Fibrobacterales bacterium]